MLLRRDGGAAECKGTLWAKRCLWTKIYARYLCVEGKSKKSPGEAVAELIVYIERSKVHVRNSLRTAVSDACESKVSKSNGTRAGESKHVVVLSVEV